MPTQYVITLVHGTWAPNAAWTRPGSPLRASLEAALDGGVRFRRLLWTGRNRQADRADAASRTRRVLNAGIRAYPDASHFVIAHSHGGNIVRAALQDAELQQRVAGVVTMGTPFIDCRPRDATLQLGLFALTVAILGGFAAVVIGAQVILRVVGAATIDNSPLLPGLLGLAVLIGWVMCSRGIYRFLMPRLALWSARIPERTTSRLVGTVRIPTPFLSVGLEGDEANLGLGIAGWIADTPFRTAARLGRFVQRWWTRVLRIVWILGIPLALAGFADQRIAAMAVAGAVLLAIPALTWPFMLVVPRIPWVAFGVGRERLADSVFSHVFSTRTPPLCDRCIVKYFDPRDVIKGGRLRAIVSGTLFHSSVYGAPAVSQHIASWLRSSALRGL
jgi:hypothetical protein